MIDDQQPSRITGWRREITVITGGTANSWSMHGAAWEPVRFLVRTKTQVNKIDCGADVQDEQPNWEPYSVAPRSTAVASEVAQTSPRMTPPSPAASAAGRLFTRSRANPALREAIGQDQHSEEDHTGWTES